MATNGDCGRPAGWTKMALGMSVARSCDDCSQYRVMTQSQTMVFLVYSLHEAAGDVVMSHPPFPLFLPAVLSTTFRCATSKRCRVKVFEIAAVFEIHRGLVSRLFHFWSHGDLFSCSPTSAHTVYKTRAVSAVPIPPLHHTTPRLLPSPPCC